MDGLIVNEAHLVDRRPKDEFMAKVRTTSPLAVKWKVDGVKSFNLCRCSRCSFCQLVEELQPILIS